MSNLITIIFLASVVLLVVGLIKPSVIIRWKTEPSRKKVLMYFGGAAIASFILLMVITPVKNNPTVSDTTKSPEVANNQVPVLPVQKESAPEALPTKLNIGDEGFLRTPNSTDNSKTIFLTGEQSDYAKLGKALLAEDAQSILEIPSAFWIQAGAKVKVIDSAFGIRRVRILEVTSTEDAANVQKSGWVAAEFVVSK